MSPIAPYFSRYLLRTTDAHAAAAFYAAVLGRTLPVHEQPQGDGIVALHEAALARGARPHWLGHIAVEAHGGAEAVAARATAAGAMRLGPPPGTGDVVVLRDPDGAMVALTDRDTVPTAGVVWHQLMARHAPAAAAWYSALCGWTFGAPDDLGALGVQRRFAYDGAAPTAGMPAVGVLTDIATRPEVHSQWLYYFAVASLDEAVAQVRRLGGVVVGPFVLPGGMRLAVCDDVQGAAFGLVEPDDARRMARAE